MTKLRLISNKHELFLDKRPHLYHQCENPNCYICGAGLSQCKVCGGLEGSLLDCCPGVKLTYEQDHDWNYLVGYRYRLKAQLEKERGSARKKKRKLVGMGRKTR